MNLNDLRKMVAQDVTMNKTELDVESMKTPQLHNKYLNFYTDEKLILGKLESDYKKLRKYKWLYYTGKISQEELEEFGWEPFSLSLLRGDIDRFLDSDDDIVLMENKILLQKEKVDYLKSVLNIIMNRQWSIRASIDWIKFVQGT